MKDHAETTACNLVLTLNWPFLEIAILSVQQQALQNAVLVALPSINAQWPLQLCYKLCPQCPLLSNKTRKKNDKDSVVADLQIILCSKLASNGMLCLCLLRSWSKHRLSE